MHLLQKLGGLYQHASHTNLREITSVTQEVIEDGWMHKRYITTVISFFISNVSNLIT